VTGGTVLILTKLTKKGALARSGRANEHIASR
jgi:hypothetical protein